MAPEKPVRPKCGCKLRDTGADVRFSHLGVGADVRLDACERGREPGGVLPPASVPAEVHWSQYTLPHRAAPHSYTATDYHQELEKWRSAEFYEQEVHRIQLPFSAKVLGSVVIVEEMQERRAQQLHRLQEINARRREEMLQQDQERLDKLLAPQGRTITF